MGNKCIKNAYKIVKTTLNDFFLLLEIFFYYFLRVNQLMFLISAILTVMKIN